LVLHPKLIDSVFLFYLVRTIECCNEKCILKIEFAQLILARQEIKQLSSKGKKQWILEYLTQHDKQGYVQA
jgi:hypothetical protein